ncbi:MAG: alpha/beta fold hydrolase [Deltaproteobacteria bacterium]|nr:alpha/beta fold hydrolase [Deltaproteobacteria bacterium]
MTGIRRQSFDVQTDTGMKLSVNFKGPESDRLEKAVLLVHGSGVGWVYWDIPVRDYSIMDYLAHRGLDVYAVECRGYGESTKPNGLEVTAISTARDLRSVLLSIRERSRVEKVGAVGHSSGGTVLLVSAGLYPELLDRLVLIGTPYRSVAPQFIEYAQMMSDSAKEPGKDYVPNMHYKDIEGRLDTFDEDVVSWYKRVVEEHYPLIPGGLFPDIVNSPVLSNIKNIMVPTCIVNGSNEYVVGVDDSMEMFKDLGTPDKCMIMLPGGFHLLFLEQRGHVGLQESIYFWITKEH